MENLRSKSNSSWKSFWTVAFLSTLAVISKVACQQQQASILEMPKNTTAVVGQSVTLKCTFTEAVQCNWLKDGSTMMIPSEGYAFVSGITFGGQSNDCSIRINSLSQDDFTKWRCSTFGTSKSPAINANEIWISEQVTPSDPVIFFKNKTVTEIKLPMADPPSHLVCVSRNGNPAPELGWEMNGEPYHGRLETRINNTNLHTVELGWNRDGSWHIFDKAPELVCKARHPGFPQVKSARVVFRRNYAPKTVTIWAEGLDDRNVQVGIGENVSLACISDGQPFPTYTWEVWSEGDQTWKLFNSQNNEQNITVNIDLIGKYRCKASNDLNKYQPTTSQNELIVSEKKAEVASTGLIIGIVIGCSLVVIIPILIFVYKKRKQRAAAPSEKDGHVAGCDGGRDPEAVDDTTEKTALSDQTHEPQQNGQDDKLNGKTETSPIKIDQNVNKAPDEVVYAQLDLSQKDTAKVRTPTETEKTEYAEIRFNQINQQNLNTA